MVALVLKQEGRGVDLLAPEKLYGTPRQKYKVEVTGRYL